MQCTQRDGESIAANLTRSHTHSQWKGDSRYEKWACKARERKRESDKKDIYFVSLNANSLNKNTEKKLSIAKAIYHPFNVIRTFTNTFKSTNI